MQNERVINTIFKCVIDKLSVNKTYQDSGKSFD